MSLANGQVPSRSYMSDQATYESAKCAATVMVPAPLAGRRYDTLQRSSKASANFCNGPPRHSDRLRDYNRRTIRAVLKRAAHSLRNGQGRRLSLYPCPGLAPTRVADPVCENRRRVLVPLGKNSPILVPIRQANVRRKAALGGIFAWAPIPGPHLLQATAGLFAPEYALPQARPTSEVLLERSL